MSTASLGQAKLDKVLDKVRALHVEWTDLDDVAPNDFFSISRHAIELSLYGAELTDSVAGRWDNLNSAQKLLGVMLAERAPSPTIVPRLRECVAGEQNLLLRLSAVTALGSAEPRLSMSILESLTDDKDSQIRARVLKSMRALNRTADLDTLRTYLGDKDSEVRLQAVHSLGETAGNRALLLLLSALDDKQMGVALAARKLLVKRKAERDLALDMIARLQDFGTKGRYRLPYAVEILGVLKDERSIEPMLEHLRICNNNEVKKQIARTLAKFKDPRILPGLWRLLKDEHEKVQTEALKALKKHPHPDSLPALQAAVDRIQRAGKCSVYVHAPLVEAIQKIPGEASTQLLITCAVSCDHQLIKSAVTALQARKADVPAQRLRERLQEEDSEYFREIYRDLYARLVARELLTDSVE